MTTEEEIQVRIKKSSLAADRRQEEQKQMMLDRKEGIAFIHNNDLPVMVKLLSDLSYLTIVAIEEEEKYNVVTYRFAYALCSPRDQFSLKTAKGLAGKRLIDEDDRFCFWLVTDERITPKALLSSCYYHLVMEALCSHRELPDCFRRVCLKDTVALDDWGTSYYGID